MSILTPQKLDAAFLAYDTSYQGAFEATPTFWQRFASLVPSTTKSQLHAFINQIPSLREWIGERQIQNVQAHIEALENKKFELTEKVPRESIEDDQYGVFSPLMGAMGEASKRWPDELVIGAMKAGDSVITYDGQNFFDDEHPVDPSGSISGVQSNKFNLALTADNFQTVRSTMMSYKGAGGAPLSVNPNLLVVPPALEKKAREILKAESIAVPFSNGGNVAAAAAPTNVLSGVADILVHPFLAGDDTTWYLLDTNRSIKPFVFQQRVAPEFTFMNRPDDQNVFLTDEFLFGVRARGAAGYGMYWLAAKSTP